MPGRVMFAEIYPAEICRLVVNHDQLLVIAAEQPAWRHAVSVRKLEFHAGAFDFAEHRGGGAGFAAKFRIEKVWRRISKPVAQHDSRERVGENSLIPRGRREQRRG